MTKLDLQFSCCGAFAMTAALFDPHQFMEENLPIRDRRLLARLVLAREEARGMMSGGFLDPRNDVRGLQNLPEAEVRPAGPVAAEGRRVLKHLREATSLFVAVLSERRVCSALLLCCASCTTRQAGLPLACAYCPSSLIPVLFTKGQCLLPPPEVLRSGSSQPWPPFGRSRSCGRASWRS